MIARVIIDIKHYQVNRLFDYFVPNEMEAFLERGMRVIVPFGESKRLGFVLEVKESSELATKSIDEILDVEPILDNELLYYVDMLMKTSNISLSHAFETVLPSEIFIQYEKQVILKDSLRLDEKLRSKFNQKGIWTLKQSDLSFKYKIKQLKDAKIVETKTVLKAKGKAKAVKKYSYNRNHQYVKMNNYPDLEIWFEQRKQLLKVDLNAYGLSDSNIKTLLKHHVISLHEEEVIRKPYAHIEGIRKDIVFTQEQIKAIKTINSKKDTYLLKGVTGSGKTEVYIKLIENVIAKGKKALILVPEITLIPIMLKRLISHFENFAVYHSGLSQGERFDQYTLIRNQTVDLVIGTRSAIFLPIQNLDIIIIDECHDQAYIQDESTYYDAITCARHKAKYTSATLVLGSATPRVEDMYKALHQNDKLVELNNRPFNLPMPKIELIDMKKELSKGNTSIFSKVLLDKIKVRLQKKEQIICLFNRKGYAPYIMCRQCGHVPTCPSCQIALTYYKSDGLLKCSYCGYKEDKEQTCQNCTSKSIKEVGIGIEYVAEMLSKLLPHAKIARMDKQTTKTKHGHEMIINAFDDQVYDILLGTQMISKGIDFKNVTLAAIVMADLSLNVPNYSASEQAYMLFAQMTGRSGRFYPGEAIIQAYHLDHFAIISLTKGYDHFYKEAIEIRKLANYAPFKQMAKLSFEGTQYLKTYQEAFKLKKDFEVQEIEVLGPYEQPLSRKKGIFKFEMIIKYVNLDKKELFIKIEQMMQKQIFIRYVPMSREA